MKVRIVNYESGSWILSKISRKLHEHLRELGVAAEISQTPSRRADINHHVIYMNYDGRRYSTDTLMLTHFAFPWEQQLARLQLQHAELAFCMSRQTCDQLVAAGFPRSKLAVAHPAHDHVMQPRPLVLGLTTRLYPDGRKREQLLEQATAQFSPASFRFRIMGDGWEEIVGRLCQRGFHVEYWKRFDYRLYCDLMPSLDYYLYLGQDEGSMGFLDALAAGVPTIVTPQGFHLDVPDGITHPFETLDELITILTTIDQQHRQRGHLVSAWTWDNYAREHLQAWTRLLNRREDSIPEEDSNVIQQVREILAAQQTPERLSTRIYRLAFQEGPVRVGRRVLHRWMNAAR
ncbi:MAG: glycosyltransferase [Planctomycetes bacterium]|nr:glycosyltransferase [Planctomycetota bacterium]